MNKIIEMNNNEQLSDNAIQHSDNQEVEVD
jgi:hypothetical protein